MAGIESRNLQNGERPVLRIVTLYAFIDMLKDNS
jgi:hypothetical protein